MDRFPIFDLPGAIIAWSPVWWEVSKSLMVGIAMICFLFGMVFLIVNSLFSKMDAALARVGLALILITTFIAVFGNWVMLTLMVAVVAYIALYLFGYKVIWANILLALSGDKPKNV